MAAKPHIFKLISPKGLLDYNMVAELIDRRGCWNEQLIWQKFLLVDVKLILEIPLPHASRQDKLVWHDDKRGIYSVKSGYQVSLMMKLPENLSCSNGAQGGFKFL